MHAYSGGETNTLLLPVYKRLSFSCGHHRQLPH